MRYLPFSVIGCWIALGWLQASTSSAQENVYSLSKVEYIVLGNKHTKPVIETRRKSSETITANVRDGRVQTKTVTKLGTYSHDFQFAGIPRTLTPGSTVTFDLKAAARIPSSVKKNEYAQQGMIEIFTVPTNAVKFLTAAPKATKVQLKIDRKQPSGKMRVKYSVPKRGVTRFLFEVHARSGTGSVDILYWYTLGAPQPSKMKIDVQFVLADADEQFVPADRGSIVVFLRNGTNKTHRNLRFELQLRGAANGDHKLILEKLLTQKWLKNGPALQIPRQKDPLRYSKPLPLLAAGSSLKFEIPLQVAGEDNAWIYSKLIQGVANRAEKPSPEASASLADVFHVRIAPAGQRTKPLFENRVVLRRGDKEVRLQYPDYSKSFGTPTGASKATLEYYRDGDPEYCHPVDPYVRALAIRAARYGKEWDRSGAVDIDEPPIPESPEALVRNVAWFVDQALEPENAPDVLWEDRANANGILTGEYGYGKLPPVSDPEEKKVYFVCQEHSLLFGTLIRALGMQTREVNIYTRPYLLQKKAWQDAANEVYYAGTKGVAARWHFWGQFGDGYQGYDGSPFKDFHKHYTQRYQSYEKWVGAGKWVTSHGDDTAAYSAGSRFNLYMPRFRSAWKFEGFGTWRGFFRHESWAGHFEQVIDVADYVVEKFEFNSPLVATVVLPDGRRIGAARALGDPNAWFFSRKGKPQGLVNTIPHATYYPEGLRLYSSAADPKSVTIMKQTIVVPLPKGVAPDKLRIEMVGTGKGPWSVTRTTLSRKGQQSHKPISGTITPGQKVSLRSADFQPLGKPVDWHELLPDEAKKAGVNLGVVNETHDPILARMFQVPFTRGALVARVVARSPAALAGIRPLDVITRVGEQKIDSRISLRQTLDSIAGGQTVSVSIVRQGQPQMLTVRFGSRSSKISEARQRRQQVVIAENFEAIESRRTQSWDEGFRVTNLTADGKSWASVLTRHPPHTFQSIVATSRFDELKKKCSEFWEHGWSISDLAFDGSKWRAVFTKGLEQGKQMLVAKKSPKDLGVTLKKSWTAGYRATSMTHGRTAWIVVLTKKSGLSRQAFKATGDWDSIPLWIKEQWQKNRKITAAAHHDGTWCLLASVDKSLGKQRWSRRKIADLKSSIADTIEDGHEIQCLAGGTKGWLLISNNPKTQ